MDKVTQEMVNRINSLITFNDNLLSLCEQYPESEADVDILVSYVDHQIKKTIKDIIHIEKL